MGQARARKPTTAGGERLQHVHHVRALSCMPHALLVLTPDARRGLSKGSLLFFKRRPTLSVRRPTLYIKRTKLLSLSPLRSLRDASAFLFYEHRKGKTHKHLRPCFSGGEAPGLLPPGISSAPLSPLCNLPDYDAPANTNISFVLHSGRRLSAWTYTHWQCFCAPQSAIYLTGT